MTSIRLKRQIITDDVGNPVGVVLPLDEYARVKEILDDAITENSESAKIKQMMGAVEDPLFMADLKESMSAFANSDAEWWEPKS